MVTAVFGDTQVQLGLDEIPFSKSGRVNSRKLDEARQSFVSSLTRGELCAVQEKRVVSNSSWKGIFLFRLGNGGMRRFPRANGFFVGLDVLPEQHSLLGAREGLVLETMHHHGFKNLADRIDISRAGIAYQRSWNEGTFSPTGGWEVVTPVGSQIQAIYVGEKNVLQFAPTEVAEYKLRRTSIPFTLPSQYLLNSNYQPFGNIPEIASKTMLELLTEKGHVSRPFTREERQRVRTDAESFYEESGKHSRAKREAHWRRAMDSITASDQLSDRRNALYQEGKQRIEHEVRQTMVINAVASELIRGLSAGHPSRSRDGAYEIYETNACFVRGKNNSFTEMLPRGYTLVPSQLFSGMVYVLPKNEYSIPHALETLTRFNATYPDTRHIESAKQNFFPASLWPRKKH